MKWTNPCTGHWVNVCTMIQRINESVEQWVDESMNRWINESVNQRIIGSTSQWVNESMNRSTVEWLNESMNQGLTRINERMNRWVAESLNQGTNESINFANLILQKCSDPLFFCDFEVQIKLSLQSRAHFASFIFQKCSDPISFLWNANWALATVWCIFCRPHFPKVLRSCQFLAFWSANRALAAVQRTFCRQLSPAPAEAEILLRQPEEPHYPNKTKGFRPRERFQPWIHTRPNCFTPQLLVADGWHDDVVDMMVGVIKYDSPP